MEPLVSGILAKLALGLEQCADRCAELADESGKPGHETKEASRGEMRVTVDMGSIDALYRAFLAECTSTRQKILLLAAREVSEREAQQTQEREAQKAREREAQEVREREAQKVREAQEVREREAQEVREREAQKVREAYLLFPPPSECATCGENEWEFLSLSPNKKSARYKCTYCSKSIVVKPDDVKRRAVSINREPIPKEVQREVWQRDGGKCVICGSQERLEFDHIIPHSKGGANTARNLQLLCEECNRKKRDNDPGEY
jgi:5-methylcytosine-specific restriction endonuclease McrA